MEPQGSSGRSVLAIEGLKRLRPSPERYPGLAAVHALRQPSKLLDPGPALRA